MDAISTQSLKQVPALAHPHAWERRHVQSQLESSSNAPIVALHAPAGYGKTTALARFAAEAGASARWLTLDASDASITSLALSMVSAIYGWEVAPPATPPDVREAAKWIVGAIEEFSVTAIVLDDYETIAASDEANQLVEAVATRLPAFVRLLIGSEVVLPFVRRARLRQAVVELDRSDLAFDPEDVADFLLNTHHYDVPSAVASLVARNSNGCAAVVNLIGQLVHELPRYLRVDFDVLPLGTTDAHITVLVREVLARAGISPAKAARDLEGVTDGDRDGTLPADALLDALASRNCLAQVYATDPPRVVPHALLRRVAAAL